MSTLFGPFGKSIVTGAGGTSFSHDSSLNCGVTSKIGNVYYGAFGSGKSMTDCGSTSYISKGIGDNKTVTHMGNVWYCGSDTYTRMGSTLYGPHGTWTGITSDDDVKRIILEEA